MTEPELSVADQRAVDAHERGRRWLVVLRLVAAGRAPGTATPEDFTWDDEPGDAA